MKKFSFIIIASLTLLLTACSSKNLLPVEDGQSLFCKANLAKGTKLYYYTNVDVIGRTVYEGDMLVSNTEPEEYPIKVYCIDPETKEVFPWCYKADCTHSDLSCNAWFSPDEWLRNNIFFYGGKICMFSKSDKGIFLECFDEDGSNQKKLLQLTTSDNIPNYILLHRGYIFYSTAEGIFKRTINGKSKEEKIFEIDDPEEKYCTCLYSCGDMLVFSVYSWEKNNDRTWIITYDIKNGTLKELISGEKDVASRFGLQDERNVFFYKNNEGLYRMNAFDGSRELVFGEKGNAGRRVFSDGEVIYVDNLNAVIFQGDYYNDGRIEKRQIQLFDSDGKFLSVITNEDEWDEYKNEERTVEIKEGEAYLSTDNMYEVYGGAEWFFYKDSEGLYYTRKDELKSGNSEWIVSGIGD